MKKTIKINISGIIFHIDEDAYEKLQNYLDSINRYFESLKEGREIIADIESRIAELFQAKITDQKQVITLADVNEVVEIMGNPEDFMDTEESVEEEAKERTTGRSYRRFYRDPDHAILGGVCGGLGAYFNISPVFIRILFFIFLIIGYGISAVIYLILWLVIPKAETTAQKLEMRGETVTVSNIEKSIKEEFDNITDNFRKMKKSKGYNRVRDVFNEIFHVIRTFFILIFKIIIVIIGIAFIIAGFVALMSFLGVFFFKHVFFPFSFFGILTFSFPDFLTVFTDPGSVSLIMVTLFLTIIIPLLALIYGGLKLIFRFRANDKIIGLTAFVFWFLSVLILVSMAFIEGKNYSASGRSTETYSIEGLQADTLYIEMNTNKDFNFYDEFFIERDDIRIYRNEDGDKLFGQPELFIRKSDSDKIELIVERRSQGKSKRNAIQNAKNIDYSWEEKDSLLILDPYFTIAEGEKWRIQSLDITLRLPEEKVICLGEDMEDILNYIYVDNKGTTQIWKMTGKKLIMKEDGLTQINKNND